MPLLKDVVIIFGIAVVILLLCNRLRIPTIAGFLFTGVLIGPYGLKLIEQIENVNILAEVGVLFLLFTIGLELSLTRLLEMKRYFLIGGVVQVGLTALFGFAAAQFVGRPIGESIFLGFLLAMSSTAIVLKSLEQRDEADSPQGRVALGILIFQDIIAIPMMLLTPILANTTNNFDPKLLTDLLLGFIAITLAFPLALKIVPPVLYEIAKTRSRELFLFAVLTICFAVAWLSSVIGLSLALGAFLAGLIISKSDYRHEAIGNIMPLQDIFISLFFVSIGMLLDYQFLLDHLFLVIAVTLGVIAMKSVVAAFAAFCLGMSLRIMILIGLALSQIGEFSFVLARAGRQFGLANDFLYQLFLSVALLTMAASPSLINLSHRLVQWLSTLKIPKKWKNSLFNTNKSNTPEFHNHLVIIGFGVSGRNLAHMAQEAHLNYVILEMNPDTVKREKANGLPIHFGDGTHEAVLKHLFVPTAKSVAIMINDRQAAKRVIALARQLNPHAYIIVRARYVKEIELMKTLGANDVIADEFGTALEMCVRVMRHSQITEEQINALADDMRSIKI